MRIIHISLDNIIFEHKAVSDSLRQSINRIGLSFPIKVIEINGLYQCIDGHKRLCILKEISECNPEHRFLKRIPVIIVNSDLNRSNDCWRQRNMH